MQEYHFKILVVGEQACGKTCILHRYIKDVFLDQLKMTVGVDFTVKQIKWDDSTLLRLQFWDIAGQERYGHMTPVCVFSPPFHTHTRSHVTMLSLFVSLYYLSNRCTTAKLLARLWCTT